MDIGDMMPVGPCCVCGTQLDHTEAGFCKSCGEPFCWSGCGGWWGSSHRCDNCLEEINNENDIDGEDLMI